PPAGRPRRPNPAPRLNHRAQLVEKPLSARGPPAEQEQRRKEFLTERRQVQDAFDAFAHRLEQTYGPAAGQVFDRARLQMTLPADTALLGWLDRPALPRAADPHGEHWAVLLRATGAPRWLRLRGSGLDGTWPEADTRLPADLRAALHTPRGEWQPLASRLRAQRLEPLAKALVGGEGQPAVRHLVVVPAPALAGVPVEIFAQGYTV